jgi:DNA invertase Pin-like site-specific DNA recombinase
MKTALYCRVSTDKQENGNQLLQLREFAAKEGWEVVTEFVDVVSGSGKQPRPEFEKMMRAASQHKFDTLLIWKLDRLSREGVRKTLEYLTQLDSWKVRVRSYMEPFLDTGGIMRDVLISMMAMLAQQERVSISERTKAGLQRAKKAGKRLGAKPLDLDMREIQERQMRGDSLRKIARDMGISIGTICSRVKAEREKQNAKA